MKISPTILKVKLQDKNIIQKELFSSILPVIGIDNKDSASKKFIKLQNPFQYIFGGNKKIHHHISKVTSSGTVCINDVILHVLIPNLPFGGVGESGMGKFHGEEGFKNFSNQKYIANKNFLFNLDLRYPLMKKL